MASTTPAAVSTKKLHTHEKQRDIHVIGGAGGMSTLLILLAF
jgi:hypothetical protein